MPFDAEFSKILASWEMLYLFNISLLVVALVNSKKSNITSLWWEWRWRWCDYDDGALSLWYDGDPPAMVAKCRATWQHTGNNHCLMPPPKPPPAYSGCLLCANTTFVSSGYSSKYELSTTTWNSTFVGHNVATQFGFIINHNFPHVHILLLFSNIVKYEKIEITLFKYVTSALTKNHWKEWKNRNEFNSKSVTSAVTNNRWKK